MFFKGRSGNSSGDIKHVCVACGEHIVTHEHGSYLEVKRCMRGMKALYAKSAKWPGSLPSDGGREPKGGSAMNSEELREKLWQLGPERKVDGRELCPACDGLSRGLDLTGEHIVHCRVCNDQHVVSIKEADAWRDVTRRMRR
jgi:hypothetical protein